MNRFCLTSAALLGLSTLALAQVPGQRVFVSTSTDQAASGGLPAIDDADLVAAGGGTNPAPQFAIGQWLATAGFVPSDVDAFGRRPGTGPGRAGSFAFSILANENGFADGDVLGFGSGGGVVVLIPEDTLATALGVATTAIDIDALDFDGQGRLYFSLQSDLAGTTLGDLSDGDILRLEAGGFVTMVLDEAQVQACFTTATGSSSSIADVQALDVVGNDIWVATQSPTAFDGAVLRCGAVIEIVIDEAGMGLGGAEIDALSVAQDGDELPVVLAQTPSAAAGSNLQLSFWGTPNSIQLVLPAGNAGYLPFAHVPGFGAWYLDRTDPWLNTIAGNPLPFAPLNAQGRRDTVFTLPVGLHGLDLAGNEGWSFQSLEFPSLKLSAPMRVAKQ